MAEINNEFETPTVSNGAGVEPKGAAIPFAVTAVVGGNFFLVLNVSVAGNGVGVVNGLGTANVVATKNVAVTKTYVATK